MYTQRKDNSLSPAVSPFVFRNIVNFQYTVLRRISATFHQSHELTSKAPEYDNKQHFSEQKHFRRILLNFIRSDLFSIMRYLLFFITVLVPSLLSCEKEDESPRALAIEAGDVVGDWRIARFISEGADITDQFGEGVILNISSNGGLFFENSPSNDFGSWFIEGLDSLRIDITNINEPYVQFEDVWAVISKSASSLELLDIDDLNNEPPGENSNDADGDTSERVTLTRVQEP